LFLPVVGLAQVRVHLPCTVPQALHAPVGVGIHSMICPAFPRIGIVGATPVERVVVPDATVWVVHQELCWRAFEVCDGLLLDILGEVGDEGGHICDNSCHLCNIPEIIALPDESNSWNNK